MVKYFHFHAQGQPNFDRPLEIEQCDFTRNNVRCKKNCQIGLSKCWIHLLSEKKLRILDSPPYGKGLFALDKKRDANAIIFPINRIIVDYEGERIDEDLLNERYGNKTAPYAIEYKEGEYHDCAIHRCVGSLINHSGNQRDINCKFYSDYKGKRIGIKAIEILEMVSNYECHTEQNIN